MSRFEQLPKSVRCKILRYLLIADSVRQPPNQHLVEPYAFNVSTLGINSTIGQDATEILYNENLFIKVKWFFESAFTSMVNHEIHFSKLTGAFDHHVVEISIKSDAIRQHIRSKKAESFLLLAEELPKFTRLLRLLDLANFMAFQFTFNLRQPPLRQSLPILAEQDRLLAPFEAVRGGAMIQEVIITGPFDAALKARVKQAMTQKVAWLRAGAWEIHDIALSIKRKGDLAWQLGNADMTLAKYDDTRAFEDNALKNNSMIVGLDNDFHYAMARLGATNRVDTALCMMTDMVERELGHRGYKAVPNMTVHIEEAERINKRSVPRVIVPPEIIARFYWVLGVAELGLGHPNKAGAAFATAYKTITTQEIKSGHQAARDWRNLSKAKRNKRLTTLLTALPKKPCDIPDMSSYMTVEVASEHWVMRELGYQGDIPYADMIKPSLGIAMTMKPHPNKTTPGPRTARLGEVHPNVLRKHVEKYRKAISQSSAKGKFICWVGLNADEIGEDSIWDDDPEHAKNLETFGAAQRANGDCVVQ